MNKNICAECGTENEEIYEYCKNCGAPVKSQESSPQTNTSPDTTQEKTVPNSEQSHNQEYTNNNFYSIDSIDGIPKEEITLYIGSKANDILPKFNKMELSGSKISWCWPAAIFGFLLGPLGSALWFFYRKMYKPALILSAIGAVITLVTSLLTIGDTSITIDAFINAFSSGDFEQALNSLESADIGATIPAIIANLINEIASTVSGILCGLFGFYVYKKHCVNKILTYRSVQINPNYYYLGLPAIGGVSGGMLVLGIAILILVNNIASFFTVISALIFR